METWAFIVGLVIGTIAVLGATWVWVKDKKYGIGGGSLTVVGAVLIGMSVWGQIRIKVTESGVELDLFRETVEAVSAVAAEVDTMARAVEASREQFIRLTRELEQRAVLPSAALQPIRRSVEVLPAVNHARLDSARATLDTAVVRQLLRIRRPKPKP